MCYQKEVLILFMFSFFLGELEKCLEDPEKLGSLFVKHVSANVTVVGEIPPSSPGEGIGSARNS